MDRDDAEEAIISADDFRTAIDTCCQNREKKEAYVNAPQGARMYLGLLFYQMHFGAKADEQQIQEVLADIEPELQIRDINYLLDTPVVSETEKRYLSKLRETIVERNELYVATPAVYAQQAHASHHYPLPMEERHNDESNPQGRKISCQEIDHEFLKRMEEQRRYKEKHKEKLLDIGTVLVKAVATIVVVCVVGWVVRLTWNELKRIERQKLETGQQEAFNQKISEMKAEVTSISNALMSAENTSHQDRQRANEMKSKYEELKQTYKSEMERTAAEYKSKLDELNRINEGLNAELTHLRNIHRMGMDEGRKKIIEPKESRDDLIRQLNDNRTEIQDLCKKNPACYINQRTRIFTKMGMQLTQPATRCRICLHERQGVP